LATTKAAVFSIAPYQQSNRFRGWPVPVVGYSTEVGHDSMQRALEQFELADEQGFDWVTVAEHHCSPASLTPNPMVMAAAVIERVKRAKIALLGDVHAAYGERPPPRGRWAGGQPVPLPAPGGFSAQPAW